MEVEVKLKQLLKERNIKQNQLAEMTGLTTRAISELANDKYERISKKTLCKIAEALEIKDISEIIDFKETM